MEELPDKILKDYHRLRNRKVPTANGLEYYYTNDEIYTILAVEYEMKIQAIKWGIITHIAQLKLKGEYH